MLQVHNLQTAYGPSQVLFDISFQIKPGEAVTLLGRNGMGKTTTVRSIMGLTRAKGGTISFRGRRIEREASWKCLERLRQAGQTLLVIDKYLERLVRLADRHTIIERGRVAWQGSSAELAADRGLWHRYLGV